MTTQSALEIHVHLCDGSVSRFAQSDANLAAQMLESLQPARFFAQPSLIFAGEDSLTAFPAGEVARVDFLGPATAVLRSAGPQDGDWQEVDESAWNQQCSASRGAHEPGEVAQTVLSIQSAGGGQTYIQIVSSVPSAMQQRQILQNLFSGPSHILQRLGGGATLINTAKIVKVVFCPALEAPTTAWQAAALD